MSARPSGRAADLPTILRPAVVLPAMPPAQERAWLVLIDLDGQDTPWALVGGQMTLLHCLEHGIDGPRANTDGDIVLDVWTRRDAVATTGRWLQTEHGFSPVPTTDGFSYRYADGTT